LCCARWKAVKLTELVSQSQMVRTQADSLQVESRSLSNNHPKVTPSAEALAFQATFPLPAGDLYPALQQTYFSAKWELPSQGVEYSECGTVEAKSWCPGECWEFKHDLLYSCNRSECPVCSGVWASKAGARITERMWNYHLLLLKSKVRNTRLSHVTFSPPEDQWSDFKSMRARAYEVMKVARVRGASVIFHAHRFRDVDGNEVAWKHCSLNPAAVYPIIQAEAVYSPHFHGLTAGFLMNSDKFERLTGWVYIKHGDLETRDDVFQCARYLVSHMGLSERRTIRRKSPKTGKRIWVQVPLFQSITYIGECSYSQLIIVNEERRLEAVTCPDCGACLELHYQKSVDVDGRPVEGLKVPWIQLVRYRTWAFRPKKDVCP